MPQQPRRFQADSLDEAYGQVRDALGEEAVILATRRATAPSLHGRPPKSFVEILAHVPEASTVPSAAGALGSADSGAGELAPPFANPLAGSGNVSAELLAQAGVASEDDRASWSPTAPLGNGPDTTDEVAAELAETAAARRAAPTDMEQMTAELAEIRTIVEQLAVERVDGVIDQSPAPLRWLRQRFRDQGIKSTIAATVLQQIADAQVATSNADALRRTVARQLATMMPAAPHLDLARRPALIALVGPAGAGKTTLAMKLAVEVERAYSLNVVVAGTDVERAGAPQQFTAVGAAAGVQTRLCYTPGELQALVNEGVADVVIVDTAGHDGTRRDRMTELQTFIHASRQREVLLTLPATLKTGDMERLTEAFAPLEPLGVALTRCDDTATMGEPLSALIGSELGLVFTTHSDSVADAPRPGDNLGLAQAVLTGEWSHSSVQSDRAA